MSRRLLLASAAGALLAVGVWAVFLALRPDSSPAPATQRALAAVAVDVLDIEPTGYDITRPPHDAERMGVDLKWLPSGASDTHFLQLRVKADDGQQSRPCERQCAVLEVDGDSVELRWHDIDEYEPYRLRLTYVAEGERRSLTYSGADFEGDPREADDLPFTVEELARVVTDDRFSRTTTQEMVDTDLPHWPAG